MQLFVAFTGVGTEKATKTVAERRSRQRGEHVRVRVRPLVFFAVVLITASSALACSDDASDTQLVTHAGLRSEDPAQIHAENARVIELQVQDGCVVAIEEGARLPLVAIWPASARLTDEGVELDGRTARFGEQSRLVVAVAAGDDRVAAQVKKCGSDSVQYYTAIVE